MDAIKFTLPCIPTAQMRARSTSRGGYVRHYKHAKQQANENEIKILSRKYAPGNPWECAINIRIVSYMPIPKSWSKLKKEMAKNGELKHITKPDIDNLTKNIFDCFNGLFWLDDKQVVGLIANKFYSKNPRWEIEISKSE